MLKENLTFNDLPEMVGRLCEKIESLENTLKESLAKELEKPRDFDPFGQTRFAHLWLQYDCPFKVLVLGVNFILPF